MKKQVITAIVVAGIGMTGLTQAYGAWGKRGGWQECACQQTPQQIEQLDPATQEKLDAFMEQTQDLRKELVMKRAEKRALMRSENPDPAAASALAGELYDLHQTLQAQAEAAGIDEYFQQRRGPGAGGYGMKNMRGGGRGPRAEFMTGQPNGPGQRNRW